MLRIAIIVFIVSVLFVDYGFSSPDAVVFQEGDVRITGPGNGLVFPDGSVQYSAVISAPIHGTIGGLTGGTVQSGSGFTSTRTSVGSYAITFTNALAAAPDCFVSAQGNVLGGNGYVACELSELSTQTSINVICLQYPPPSGTGPYTPVPINSLFTFICFP
jgi:hypothetical protein